MGRADSGLFASGKILLLGTPQNGGEGAQRLMSRLCSGDLGITWDRGEVWVVMTNRGMDRLRIFHADGTGYSLTTRILYECGAVRAGFRKAAQGLRSITRGELRQMVETGSIETGRLVDQAGNALPLPGDEPLPETGT
ncbi:MAG: hypothetical protein K6A65_03395 [Succinivibrionaceae bacterium]|nr:hypothetical protein [Succinivibrionaceae bacterium]